MAKKAVIRNAAGQPFSQWKPAEKFAWQWQQTGLQGGTPTLEFEFHAARKWRFDFAWPAMKVAVEIDGFGYGHQAQQQMAADNEKANAAVQAGWRLLRFNSRQLGSQAGVAAAVDMTNQVLCGVKE